MKKIIGIALIFVLKSVLANDSPEVQARPSFDCAKALTKVEKTICADGYLSGLDSYLSYVYGIAIKAGDPSALKKEQRKWLQKRKECLENDEQTFYDDGLIGCYSSRISHLISKYEIEQTDEFYSDVATKMGIAVPSGFSNRAEKFVFFNNLKWNIEGYADHHCQYNPEAILSYSSPLLLTRVSGSTVCGGTSSPVTGTTTYCEKDGRFVEGGIWACKPKGLSDEDYLLKYLKGKTVSAFVDSQEPSRRSKNNSVVDFLYSLPIHSLSDGYMGRVFTEKFIAFAEGNMGIFSGLVKGYEAEVVSILDGMECTYNMIINKSDWSRILESHVPGFSVGKYWYGNQFDGCKDFDKQIVGEAYTYKELYVLLWRQLYISGGFERARKLMPVLRTMMTGGQVQLEPKVMTEIFGYSARRMTHDLQSTTAPKTLKIGLIDIYLNPNITDRLTEIGFRSIDVVSIPFTLEDISKYDVVYFRSGWAGYGGEKYEFLEKNFSVIHEYIANGGGLYVEQPNPYKNGDEQMVTPKILPYKATFNYTYAGIDTSKVTIDNRHPITKNIGNYALPMPSDTVEYAAKEYMPLIAWGKNRDPSLLIANYGKGRIVICTHQPAKDIRLPTSDEIIIRMINWLSPGD